jgi:amylovoran biosynthesis glycosyltransferase AmsD
MVLIEAKAHGLPAIAFDCPTGPKEIIRPGIDGYLIADDSEAFADAAMALMTNDDLRRRMGEAAQEDHRARFSVDSIIEQWRDLIEGLHADQSSRRGMSAADRVATLRPEASR